MRTTPLFALLVLFAACPPGAGQAPAQASKLDRFRLDNGLKVILRRVPNTKDVALVVLYAIGEDHDPKGKSGLGHMLEHLYVTAAAGDAKARTIQDIIARYPRGWNAQTGDRYTVIAWVFAKQELDRELKDATARMSDLRMAESDLQRERPRVLEEVDNMFGGIPPLAAPNHARELVRPTPLGGRKGGAPDQVKTLTLEELRTRWRDYYKPRNAILVLAGDIDLAQARRQVTALFGKIPSGQPAPAAHEPGKPQLGKTVEVTARSVGGFGQTAVALTYPAPAPGSELYLSFLALVVRLQDRASAELEVGPGRFPVMFRPLDDPSTLTVCTVVRKGETPAAAVKRLKEFVADTVRGKVRSRDLSGIRGLFGFFLGVGFFPDLAAMNNVYGEAYGLGRREQLGLDPARLEKALPAVTPETVQRAAREIFGPGRWAAAVVAPRKE
jgi:zinc protease